MITYGRKKASPRSRSDASIPIQGPRTGLELAGGLNNGTHLPALPCRAKVKRGRCSVTIQELGAAYDAFAELTRRKREVAERSAVVAGLRAKLTRERGPPPESAPPSQ